MIVREESKITVDIGILAGGKSTRMGMNKALLKFGNETVIGRLTNELGSFGKIFISAASKGLYERDGVTVIYDENDDIGPIEGIRRVLTESSSEYVFICAADMPFISSEIVEYLSGYISSDFDCFVLCDEEHIHPLCAVYSKRILPVIEQLIKEEKYCLRDILDRVRTRYIDLSYTRFDRKTVCNINTKDEYIRLSFPVVYAVCGHKDSGKTWLICELINEFIKEGLTVGVIKHDGHDLISETKDTDTYRAFEKGAAMTAVTSPSKTVTGIRGEMSPEALIDMMKRQETAPDMIILEGFKGSSFPKIEILRQGEKEVCPDRSSVFFQVHSAVLTGADMKAREEAVRETVRNIKDHFGL